MPAVEILCLQRQWETIIPTCTSCLGWSRNRAWILLPKRPKLRLFKQ